MFTMVRTLGRALPAGSAILILAACGGTSTPTAPVDAVAAVKATEATADTVPVSVTVRGSVVDSANRSLANINIECLGDVACSGGYSDVSAEGHDHQFAKTDANGLYEIVATGRPGGSGFMINANGRGYEVQWRQVQWPDPVCSSDQPRCTIAVNFRLNPVAD